MKVIAAALAGLLTATLAQAAEKTPPVKLGGATSVEEEHVVQAGDTLWDLTARYLQNPWYWPKVWSYNPQISNPHFLYPGDKIRFYQGGEQQPAQILASSQRDLPAQLTEEQIADEKPATGPDRVQQSGQVGFANKRGMIIQNIQLLTEKELKESGTLEAALEGKIMLSTSDLAFIRYNKGSVRPAVGDNVIFYRKVSDVPGQRKHGPDYVLTLITGNGVVTDVGDKELVSVRIDKAFDPIERGQFVAAQAGPLTVELQITANSTKLEGKLLTGEVISDQLLGQFNYVFVDRGTRDGVKNGNTFVVTRDRDGYDESTRIPTQVVGGLVVVEAKDTACLALVTRSLLDLHPGDRVEMR